MDNLVHVETEAPEEPQRSRIDVDYEAMKSIFKLCVEMRNFEITQLTHRNNFFMIFQGVLLAGVVQSSHTLPVVSFLVCVAGFLVSVYQVAMAGGAKYWQEYWEEVLSKSEQLLVKRIMRRRVDRPSDDQREIIFRLFHDDAEQYRKIVGNRLKKHDADGFIYKIIMARYSVSRIPIYVGICLSIVWGLLILCTMRGYAPFGIPSFIVGFSK